ncbi:hypothetical protein [Arthrobacter sp. Y-9]|uniref:hypothetical protein n=1 Tax=Arthrobacter sp. Y-9 TaxID=3039385 RepID=UPI00241E17CD|nr:hypothetical protein [Arthrobacter sp. Y-9]WFR83908.1 hypothetical protein P9849_15305 [Arthrobacter sp. Y-9]
MHNVVMHRFFERRTGTPSSVINPALIARFSPNDHAGMPVSPGRIAGGVADATIEPSQAVSFGRKL